MDYQRVREAAERSLQVFMETVWKDRDGKPLRFSDIHKRIGAFIDEAERRGIPAVVLAPYGVGKTELGLGKSLQRVVRDPTSRGSIVSDIDDHGKLRVETLRRVIKQDPDFHMLWPEIEIHGRDAAAAFRLKQSKHAKDNTLESTGVMGSITGGRRDWFFFDDLCTEKNSILEPASRVRVKSSFFGQFTNRLVPGGWWFYIGTKYHADDLTHALLSKKKIYATLVIGVREDYQGYDFEESWPCRDANGDLSFTERRGTIAPWHEVWPPKEYERRHVELEDEGEAIKWYSGYRNMVVDPATQAFRAPWFQRTVPVDPYDKYKIRVMYADPASSEEKKADYYAGVVLGYDPTRRAGIVLHAWKVREGLTARVERFLDAWETYQPHKAGVEGKHEISFRQRIEERAVERGLPFRVVRVNHSREKEARIGGLAPLIEKGRILFDGKVFPEFWKEAELFPRAANDDLMDALEGAWDLMRRLVKRKGQFAKARDVSRQYDDPKARKPSFGYRFERPSPPDRPTRKRTAWIEDVFG